MATKVRVIKDIEGNPIAPVTSTKAVLNSSGQNVETLLDEKVGFKDVAGDIDIPIVPEGLSNGVVDLSMMDIFGNYVGTRETANCYVVSEPGYYKFPLVYGNGIIDKTKNTAAYTNGGGQYQANFVNSANNTIHSPYIEEDVLNNASRPSVEVLIADEPNLIDNLEVIDGFPCKFIKFHVDRIPKAGANAIIGLRSTNILWSWHIWLWDQINHPLEEVTITNYEGNSYKILNYNLASKYDEDGEHLISWYYQWGRKDPMLCSASYNSTTDHASFGTTSFTKASSASTVSVSIKNPCTFYKSNSSYNYNWVQLNYFYNFWDATCNATGFTEKTIVKTVYDPCPRGYSIPNARVFTGFTTTGQNSSNSSQFNVIGSWNRGWNFKTADGGSVYFPSQGLRYYIDGNIYNPLSRGYYFTASNHSNNSAYSGYLYIVNDQVIPLGTYYRTCGFSVRPCKIQ